MYGAGMNRCAFCSIRGVGTVRKHLPFLYQPFFLEQLAIFCLAWELLVKTLGLLCCQIRRKENLPTSRSSLMFTQQARLSTRYKSKKAHYILQEAERWSQ